MHLCLLKASVRPERHQHLRLAPLDRLELRFAEHCLSAAYPILEADFIVAMRPLACRSYLLSDGLSRSIVRCSFGRAASSRRRPGIDLLYPDPVASFGADQSEGLAPA